MPYDDNGNLIPEVKKYDDNGNLITTPMSVQQQLQETSPLIPPIKSDMKPSRPFMEFFPTDGQQNQAPHGHGMEIVAGGFGEAIDRMRNYATDKIAMDPYPLKEGRARIVSLTTEPMRVLGDILNDPIGLATGLSGGIEEAVSRLFQKPKPRPVVLPPEVPPAQKLLPGRFDRFTAGPGGVQETALLNPQEEARLLGHQFKYDDAGNIIPAGKPSTGMPHSVDLGEVAEQQRLQGVTFGANEQAGHPRMEINPPTMDIPVQSGDTRLGFSPQTSAELGYPENIIPNQVRPRSAQTMTRALTPDRMVEPAVPGQPISFESPTASRFPSQQPIAQEPEMFTGTGQVIPGEPNLPSAPPKWRQKVIDAQENSGLKLADTKVENPVVADAVNKIIEQESNSPSWWKAAGTQLRQQSEELWQKAAKFPHIVRQYQADWVPPLEKAVRLLTKEERANFGAYVEGTKPITNPNLQAAVDTWKEVSNRIGDEAAAKGLRLYKTKGEWIPFQKRPDYWPHMPAGNLGKEDLVQKLVDSGLSRFDARHVLDRYRREGELAISPQHARLAKSNIPYKLDADVALQHARSMSKAIAKHDIFGPLDVKGKGAEGIADLIEGTKNRNLTTDIMTRVVGRDEFLNNPKMVAALNKARKYSSVAKLWNFTLANVITGQAPTALKAATRMQFSNPSSFVTTPVEVGTEILKLFSSRYRDEIAKSGAVQNFSHSLMEELSGMDPWMIGKGETINRSISAATGRALAKLYHSDLLKNPADALARKELGDLVLEPIDNLLKQQKLTDRQLNMAAGRAAELAQTLNVPTNLPLWVSDPVRGPMSFTGQLMTIFKKTAYQQTKMIKDTIKANPAVNIPIWLALTQATGELTGDVKKIPIGAVKGNIVKEIESRGEWIGLPRKYYPAARMIDNGLQAFTFGLFADALTSSTFGPSGLLESVAGPVIGDVSKFSNRVMQAGASLFKRDPAEKLGKVGKDTLGDVNPLVKEALKK